MNAKLQLPRTDYRCITMALNAVAELDDGEYPFDTDAGEMVVNKKTSEAGTIRRNIYHNGSRIKVVDARKLLRETPPQDKKEDQKEAESNDEKAEVNTGKLLTSKQLSKKYKLKKVVKVLPESGVLKKKKLAKAIAGFEKVGCKKMTGQEILLCLAEVKKGIKAEKLVKLFDLL